MVWDQRAALKLTQSHQDVSKRTTSTGVSGRDGRELADAVDVKHLDLFGRELGLDGGAGRRDVLERGGGSLVRGKGARELVHEGVRVERVEQVDVARRARKDCGKTPAMSVASFFLHDDHTRTPDTHR